MVQVVADILEEVLRGRNACRTEYARELFSTLVRRLDAVLTALGEEIEREREFAGARGTAEGDALYEIYHICTVFEQEWTNAGPISLLDQIHVQAFAEGETCLVCLDHTIVPNEELEGLGEILADIAR
ncbi:MAG: hypothetical protein DI607_00605, partial [Sphingomonas hengshuiensis]